MERWPVKQNEGMGVDFFIICEFLLFTAVESAFERVESLLFLLFLSG
jgi:hypothetical protein